MSGRVVVEEKSESKKKKRFIPFTLASLKKEFSQVTWTSKPQLILLTKVVIISTFCFGFGVYIADLIIKGALDGIGTLFKMLIG